MATFEVYAECLAETPSAILVDVGEDKPVWIPKSQIDDASEVREKGDEGELVIPEWLAQDRGLI